MRLIGFVIPAGPAYSAADVLASLAKRLPAYMVPSVLVAVDDLPRSPSGKVDRNALPNTTASTVTETAPAAAPLVDIAETLIVEFMALLEVPSAGRDDSLFHLGGNSMTAIMLAARIEELYGVEVPLSDIFDDPTPRALAERVSALIAKSGAE